MNYKTLLELITMNFRNLTLMSAVVIFFLGCSSSKEDIQPSLNLKKLMQNYWDERMELFPLEATAIGDNRYNDKMPITISESYRAKTKLFYQKYLQQVEEFQEALNNEDALSKELLAYELKISLEGLNYPSHLIPINQFWSFTNEFPQLGSGSGNQPFKTVDDYDNFLARVKVFPDWVDTAIANMQKGISQGYVLPSVLAEKMVPQFKGVLTIDPTKNIFYEPIKNMPKEFSASDKKRLENAYFFQISNSIIPAYSKLQKFFTTTYIDACRATHGISSLPNGDKYYDYLIKNYTTTELSADSIYNLGEREVAFISSEMEKVKQQVGFKGSLIEFFNSINEDKQFYPFTTAAQVLDSFRSIQNIEDKYLGTLFSSVPKTKFEIRQTEAFRAASASAEYNAGSEDGTRPGIFYVPILDPKKFNVVGMETLFLHEAIPGHHFQISLQQENDSLPKFRKFLGYSAYAEGWALYTETLGKELGLYKNPYQYLGHLSDAMHRALRLVIDVGIHTKNMSHDEAIAYMMAHERVSKEEATAEIERYMAIPGQALSYKIGQLTLIDIKKECQEKLGGKFDIKDFHSQLLNGGNMPLEVLRKKLEQWANKN